MMNAPPPVGSRLVNPAELAESALQTVCRLATLPVTRDSQMGPHARAPDRPKSIRRRAKA